VRCVLIYNPVSGRRRSQRKAQLKKAADALSALGHEVVLTATIAVGSATAQAIEAACSGADVVFACGGDGTIHEVIQGLVSETCDRSATLGILPLGSANALARHLGLSLKPEVAAIQSIQGEIHTIPIGKIIYGTQSRYFIVMAGAGPDGVLAYQLLGTHKSVLGRMAYYLHAARIFSTHRFPAFEVEFTETESRISTTHKAVSVMAVRVNDLGGLFSKLARQSASVHQPGVELVLIHPPALLALPLWFVSGWLGLSRFNPFLKLANVSSFSCKPPVGPAPHFQADGEWIGRIPISCSLIPNALRILIPANRISPRPASPSPDPPASLPRQTP
jgi:diacylglycerol kinase (ATP)